MSNTIVDYPSLEQAIQDWLARSDITDATFAPEIIQVAQNNVYYGFTDNRGNYWPGLRVRQMEESFAGGMIGSLTIVGGSGYSATDTIAFSAPPTGGVQATGTLTVTNGVITGVTLTNPGLLYTSAPTATITTGSGSGASVTATLSATAQISPSGNYAVAADYLDTKYLWAAMNGGSVRLERKPAEWLYENYGPGAVGQPTYFGRDGDVFIFGPQPDSQYALSGVYYSKAELLSDSNTTDWMVLNFPHMLLYGCLSEAAAFIQDQQQVQYWQGRFTNALASLQSADKREAYSGSPLRAVAG